MDTMTTTDLARRLGVDPDAESEEARRRERADLIALIGRIEADAAEQRIPLTEEVDAAHAKVEEAEAALQGARRNWLTAQRQLQEANGATEAAVNQARRRLAETVCPEVADILQDVRARIEHLQTSAARPGASEECYKLLRLRERIQDKLIYASDEEALRELRQAGW